jgi:hypothetical protein
VEQFISRGVGWCDEKIVLEMCLAGVAISSIACPATNDPCQSFTMIAMMKNRNESYLCGAWNEWLHTAICFS